MDQDATRIKMQHGPRCNKDQDATWIKKQHGSRCNMNQNSTRIKMQHGSRFNMDQDVTSRHCNNCTGCTTNLLQYKHINKCWSHFHCYRAGWHDEAGQSAQVPLAGEAGDRGDWGRSQTHQLVVVIEVRWGEAAVKHMVDIFNCFAPYPTHLPSHNKIARLIHHAPP